MRLTKEQEKELADKKANDESKIRDFVAKHGGKVSVQARFFEVTFPKDIDNLDLRGQTFRGSSWNNLRVSLLHEGRYIFS